MINSNQQQEKPQDFELMELLFQKIPSASSDAADLLDKSFEARFQSLVNQIQSYLHSSEKPGFFPHRFLAWFSSVLDTRLNDKLGIKKLHFRFQGARTLKVVAETKAKTHVFIFTEDIEAQHSESQQACTRNFEFTTGEFKSVMGRDYTELDARKLQIDVVKVLKDKYELIKGSSRSKPKQKELHLYLKRNGALEYKAGDIRGNIQIIQINRDELGGDNTFKDRFFEEIKQFLRTSDRDLSGDVRRELSRITSANGYTLKSGGEDEKINIEVERKKIKDETITPPAEFPFQEVTKKLNEDNPIYLEDYIEKLASPDEKQVNDNLKVILSYIKEVHTNLNLQGNVYGIRAREAGQHGFVAGIFDNFRYRDNAKIYPEQFVGRGYADIMLLVRGPDRAVDSVPIPIELKAGTEGKVTPSDALKQAEDYVKGFRPNKMRILTNADNAIVVGLNLDSTEPFEIEVVPIERPSSTLMESFVELVSKWNNQQVSEEVLKQEVTDLLSSEYYTFPANKETRDIYYFSRYIIGQSILFDKFDGTDVEKYVFSYNEYPLESKTRGGEQSSVRPVTTLVFIKGGRKTAFVFHIIEQETEIRDLKPKKIPVTDIPQVGTIGNAIEITMGLKKYKENSSFRDLFEIKQINKYNPYSNDQKFAGQFLKVPNSDELKAKFDQAIASQHAVSSNSEDSLKAYKELLTEKIAEAIYPIKDSTTNEARLQAVLNGLLSSYSDLKLKETSMQQGASLEQETSAKILIIPEFQTGAGGRVDMVIQGIGPSPQGTREYTPMGLEFKLVDKNLNQDQLKQEVGTLTREQNTRYAKGAALKAITDSDKMFFMGVVVNLKAKDKSSFILTSNELVPAVVVHSSINIAQRKRLEEIQEITQRLKNTRTQEENLRVLESATSEKDYQYWLQQHDIPDIARVKYGYGTNIDTLFEVVESPEHVANQLQRFQDDVATRGERRPLTLVVNLGNNHWVTSVIAYQDGQYNGYYADSKGNSIPDNIRQVLEQAQITVHDASVAQQTDSHNCGFWALENARDINAVLRENRSRDITIGEIGNHLQVRGRDEDYFVRTRENVSDRLNIDPQRIANLKTILAEVQQPVGQCSKERKKRNIGMACVDSRDEENITKEEKERRIKELLSDEMIMKIKLKALESKINDEVLSRHEEIESIATYDVNKSDVLSNALQSLKLSKMLWLMSQKSEVSIELQEKAYYNALIDIGALVHDHKNHVHGDHLSALESRVQGNQLFSVAHDLYYLLKSEDNIDQDKLYSDQVKSKIRFYVEGENRLDDIYSEFNIIDIKGYFSDSDVKDFYTEAEAYDKEIITIHSTQVFADEVEVYVEVKDNNGNYQRVAIGDIASIQNTENYILDEETSEIKLRIDDEEYTTTGELEEGHIKHYLNIPGGYKVKVGNVISGFTGDIKEAIHSKLHRLELLASKKDVEEIINAEITDQDYNNVVGEIKQSLLQEGASEGTFNQLKDLSDGLYEKVFVEYINDIERKLEGHGIEFDRDKFDSAKVKGAKGGKFFSLMALYDMFDSISDVPTLGRHDNDALKKIFGINGILDAMDDVRESLSASYIRSDGKVVTKIPRDSAIGKVISKIPDSTRKTFVKIINNPVVQSITFATIAYQFGYSINEIVKGNHHPLNYYWTASSGVKLASMSIKPVSIAAMKAISATTKALKGLSAASKVLGKAAVVTMVADVLITIGVEIHERMEYTKSIAGQVPLLPGDEQAEVFFAKVIKAFTGRDVEKEYKDIIRIKGYLSYVKERAVQLLSNNSAAAVVWCVSSIEEKYSEIIKKDGIFCAPAKASSVCLDSCRLQEEYNSVSLSNVGSSNVKNDLSLLNISETLPVTSYPMYMKGWEEFECAFRSTACYHKLGENKAYFVDISAKHLPHLTRYEYEDLGLRIASVPSGDPKKKTQCSDIINHETYEINNFPSKRSICNTDKIHRNCENTITLLGEPFIFTKTTIGSSSPILYLSGPNRLTAAKDYPAVMYVPKGGVDYRGSTDHDNTFIINYDTCGHLTGGTESNNTVVMNYNASTISVVLHQYGYIIMEDLQPGIGLLDIHNYISHSTASQNITTDCKTRYVDAGEGGGNNRILSHNVDCQDGDYEIRKVNKKDTHFRSKKRITFIIDKSSGSSASIISSSNLESKKNLDIIFVKNIDIVQLKINEHQADYSLELLTDDKRSTVASTKIDSFKNLVIQVEHYGIAKTIIVQDKSLPDIIKDIEYQKLNHSGSGVGSEITENSKKRSKAMILAEIKGSWDITPYEVAKDIINNSILGIPIYLARAEKVIGNVTHEGIVEGMYPGEVVADFSHNCKEVITIEVKSYESKCVVKFPQAHECDHLVDFTLRINNGLPYASASYKIVDLTECNINPADVECRKSSEDDIGIGITLNGYVNQRPFHIVLDNYLLSPRYQRIALRFNEGGEFYKINDASLKLEPILYNYEKKVEVDYDSFIYYKPPNEQELQILRVYHNQPNDKGKIGFIDLRDKSIFDSNMEIIDGSLMLSHNNTTFIEVKNWNTNRPTRKIVFAFNEAMASDLECLFSTCDPEGIIEEFRKEIKKLISEKDKYGYTQLYYAAREGNLNLVTFLVDRGADINAVETSIEGKKPIHVAAMEGHKNVIEFFLSKGMSVNGVATGNGWTPLHYAAWQGHLEAARFLVDRGADINAVETSIEGKKPIHVAAKGNNKNIIELLLSKGVSVNDTDKERLTPLHWAARSNCLEAARLLVDRGADINAESSGGATPLEMAETWSEPEMVNFLKAKKQSEYDYRLLAAVKSGDVSEVTDLLNRGANIEAKDEEGWTPLHCAAWIGHLEIARLLVDRGANINAVDTTFNGGKPIHVAARGNNKNIIEFLLSKGVSVNDTDKEGWTPLHWAAWSSSLEAASFLVDRGANINAESIRGATPLGLAERWGGQEIADFLRGKQNEKPVQRKRRHHHGDHDRHHSSRKPFAIGLSNQAARQDVSKSSLQNDKIDYNKVGATSGASRPSSPIDAFAHIIGTIGGTIVDNIKGAFQFIYSPFKPAIDMKHSQPSKAMTTQSIDTNGTLLLLDVFIRKITGQKYASTADQSIPLLEAKGYALSITTEFERVLKDTAKRSGVSVNKSSFDSLEVYKAIEGKMISGELSKIPTILYSATEEAYPKNEKFLSILKGNVERMLDRQKVVNCVRSSNQVPNIVGVSDKIPLSSLNNIAIEPVNGKKGVTFAGRVG